MGEFFATEAITNAAEALVREGIQNALDAALEHKTVRVRIYVSEQDGALSAAQIGPYLKNAWPHISADGNGLISPPASGSACPFLSFEDFGTSGLDGDPEQWHDVADVTNPFYYFFRAEGQSSKGEQDRGRWGVGKTVFPRSSNISAYFGLTVRSSDAAGMLMGQSVLKSHAVREEYFSPDGYWGLLNSNGLTMPVTDPDVIRQFAKDFALKRGSETGLSVVVPYCDPEITKDALIAAVCKDYFYPILAAKLEVTIGSPSGELFIDSTTIREIAETVSEKLPNGFVDLIDLAEWATEVAPNQIDSISKETPPYPPEWHKNLLTTDQATSIQRKLESGERIALRVFLKVKPKQAPAQTTFFDVFLVRLGSSGSYVGKPLFIRDGIIISDIYSPIARGVLAIVAIQDKPLATLLGDSENPAHTQWQRQSSHYRGKYSYPGRYIPFVTRSVFEIVRIVGREDEKSDPTLLLDFFSLATPSPGRAKVLDRITKPKGKEPVDKPEITITPRPKSFRVSPLEGGFLIKRGSKDVEPPERLRIRVAYDTRRGAPLKKYDPSDFAMPDLDIESDGIQIEKAAENQLVVGVVDGDFELSVRGFDILRDLYVDVKPMEARDDKEA